RLQPLQRRFQPAIDLAILLGTVGHHEDVGDLFLADHSSGPAPRAPPGLRILLVDDAFDRPQQILGLGRNDLIGIGPYRPRRGPTVLVAFHKFIPDSSADGSWQAAQDDAARPGR